MIEVYHVLSCTISPISNRNIFSLTNIASSLLVLHFENRNNANCCTYPKSYFVKNDMIISSFNPKRMILFVSKMITKRPVQNAYAKDQSFTRDRTTMRNEGISINFFVIID